MIFGKFSLCFSLLIQCFFNLFFFLSRHVVCTRLDVVLIHNKKNHLFTTGNTQLDTQYCCYDDHKYGDTDHNTNLFLFFFSFRFRSPINSFFIDEYRWYICVRVRVCLYTKKEKKIKILLFNQMF